MPLTVHDITLDADLYEVLSPEEFAAKYEAFPPDTGEG